MGQVVRERDRWVTRWNAGPERPADPVQHLREATRTVHDNGGGELVLWVEQVDEQLDHVATTAGFTMWRELLQMRCPLPAAHTDVVTRAFADDDADSFLAVNNRAFSWHPEQGGMTLADLHRQQAEAWFDADGFRIYEHDGHVGAFCWTKVHAANVALGDPPLGEIYVIAVDPSLHGRGLGKALTLAGLQWLSDAGLRDAMLYVEHDNVAAVRTYERIGFGVHHHDRSYRMTL